MPDVTFSPGGDEHFKATLRECLEDIEKRGDYLLFDGDLYWKPSTMLKVHTQHWLDGPGEVTWWPSGAKYRMGGGVGALVQLQADVLPAHPYAMFLRDALPAGIYVNFV